MIIENIKKVKELMNEYDSELIEGVYNPTVCEINGCVYVCAKI